MDGADVSVTPGRPNLKADGFAAMASDARVEINCLLDIVNARQQGRTLARKLGFDGCEPTLIATAISEVARNIVEHARSGEIILVPIRKRGRRGIKIVARDSGPGIPDLSRAMQYGFSTRGHTGVGLRGAKWLMDEFDVRSQRGKGTTITMKKWAGQLGGQHR